MFDAAIQSQANPLPSRRAPKANHHIHRVDIGASTDPFEDMQEAAELEMLRAPRRHSARMDSDRSWGH